MTFGRQRRLVWLFLLMHVFWWKTLVALLQSLERVCVVADEMSPITEWVGIAVMAVALVGGLAMSLIYAAKYSVRNGLSHGELITTFWVVGLLPPLAAFGTPEFGEALLRAVSFGFLTVTDYRSWTTIPIPSALGRIGLAGRLEPGLPLGLIFLHLSYRYCETNQDDPLVDR